MSKEKNESFVEQFANLIKEFNKVRKGKYPGTLDKSRDIIVGLISRGTDFIKKIEGENSEYFKSIKETKYSSIKDQFIHVKGVLNALYQQKSDNLYLSSVEKSSDRKDIIIRSLQEFIKEVKSFRSLIDRIIYLKRVIKFIRNELPRSKRYNDFENLFIQFLEGFPTLYTASIIDRNSVKILNNLLSFVKEDTFDIYYVNLHEKVIEVSLELFKDGHFSQAVYESVKALNNYVKEKAKITDKDLTGAMAKAFDENDPIIKLNSLESNSDIDEQRGFKFLFMGAMTGIRNPLGHETYEINDINTALEYLSFLSLLFRKAEKGEL